VAGGRQLTIPRATTVSTRPGAQARRARQARAKFLDFFPGGFRDEVYEETERAYKWDAHKQWVQLGTPPRAQDIVRIESRTNLLFSFEKMAIRDAVSTTAGARRFVGGLAAWLSGPGSESTRFERWTETLAHLPRRQTRVLTWPVATVFGFIAQPRRHIFLKPNVTRHAAEAYGYPFEYASKPSWKTYASLLDFARIVRRDLRDLRPRDMIDIQSFLWVLGSDEYD
jgi:hypothetical protein